ncbi:hypothetical protein ACQXYO_11860, partial [Corynebacterium diphtheriae]
MIGQDVNVEDLSGLTRVLERAELLKLKNNTSLNVRFMVTPDGVNNVNHAIPFPPSQDLLFTKKILDVTDFTDQDWSGWAPGAGAADPRDLILKTDPDGRVFLFDWGCTNTQDPLAQWWFILAKQKGWLEARGYGRERASTRHQGDD